MTALIYIGAALAEIAGCFAFWAWLRMGKSPVWLAPGIASLILFAWLLTREQGKPLAEAKGEVMAAPTSSIGSLRRRAALAAR